MTLFRPVPTRTPGPFPVAVRLCTAMLAALLGLAPHAAAQDTLPEGTLPPDTLSPDALLPDTLSQNALLQNALPPAAERLTGTRLDRAGLTRVSDLFWFLNGWSAPSTEGFSGMPLAADLPGTPLLVAGGQPMPGGPFGETPLTVLPVHLQQVQRVTATRAPRLVAGRLAADGAVQLQLRPPGPGFEAEGAFSFGNEIGDPGPFRSTERGVLNVDRVGPQYLAAASLRGPQGASAQLSLRALRHYTTDGTLRTRAEYAQRLDDGPPLQQLVAPRLSLRDGELLPGRHQLSVHHARLRALPLFETLGYEVPARRRETRASLRGRVPLADSARHLRYRLDAGRAALASDEERFSRDLAPPYLSFDGVEKHIGGQLGVDALALALGGAPARLRLGLSGDYTRAEAPRATLADPDVLATRVYASLSAPTLSLRPRLTALLSQTNSTVGGGALLASRAAPGPRSSLALTLGYLRQPYAEEGTFWYWRAQGLPAPQTPDAALSLPAPASFPASGRLTADARLRYAFARGPRLSLGVSARHFRRLTLPDARYRFVPVEGPPFAPPGGRLAPTVRLRTDAGGQTLRAEAEATHAFPAALTHRLYYAFFGYHAGGSEAFAQRFSQTPRHRARYSARLDVEDRFALAGRLTVQSEEAWTAYRGIGDAGNDYRASLPAYARLDLTVTKRFWGDHVRLRLALRNLLDAPIRPHPIAPPERMALFVSLEGSV